MTTAVLGVTEGRRRLTTVAVGLTLAAISVVSAVLGSTELGLAGAVAPAVLLVACAYFALSERYEITLALLALYLGLLDGYLKLKTNSNYATLVRDALLYAIVVGALLRAAVRGTPLDTPPWVGWVLLFVAVAVVQVANPATKTVEAALGGLRPHLEFVPLFFFGYWVLRSTRRLHALLAILLAIAAINGVVSFVQYNLTPEQFAAWGPGYQERVFGSGKFTGAGRVSHAEFTASKEDETRPFGLGSDAGFAGVLGIVAAPGAFALIALSRRRVIQVLAAAATTGLIVGVITSQGRAGMVGTGVAVLVFGALTTGSRRASVGFVGVLVAGLLSYGIIASVTSEGGRTPFERFGTFDTSLEDRQSQFLDAFPRYVADYPLGNGLAKSGPARFLGDPEGTTNSESEFTYLVAELGLAGLFVLLGFTIKVIVTGIKGLRKRVDHSERLLLAALVAPLVAFMALWFGGAVMANTPGAPYFWLVAGTLAFWVGRPRRRTDQAEAAASPASAAASAR